MTDTITLTEVLKFIGSASRDDLDAIALKSRRRHEDLRYADSQALLAAIEVGAKVRVKTNIKPKYMVGMVGTVTRIDQKFAKVDFGNGRHVQRFGRIVGVPYGSLELI